MDEKTMLHAYSITQYRSILDHVWSLRDATGHTPPGAIVGELQSELDALCYAWADNHGMAVLSVDDLNDVIEDCRIYLTANCTHLDALLREKGIA